MEANDVSLMRVNFKVNFRKLIANEQKYMKKVLIWISTVFSMTDQSNSQPLDSTYVMPSSVQFLLCHQHYFNWICYG